MAFGRELKLNMGDKPFLLFWKPRLAFDPGKHTNPLKITESNIAQGALGTKGVELEQWAPKPVCMNTCAVPSPALVTSVNSVSSSIKQTYREPFGEAF